MTGSLPERLRDSRIEKDNSMTGSDDRRESKRRFADWNMTALVLFFIGHSGMTIWWASRMTAKQEFLIETVAELKTELKEKMNDRYHGSDALRDFAVRDKRIDELEQRLGKLEGRR